MDPNIVDNTLLYRMAASGMLGTKELVTGHTVVPEHEFLVVTALVDSTISYAKANVGFTTYAYATVTDLPIKAGMSVNTGPIKNLTVTGHVIGNLISVPPVV